MLFSDANRTDSAPKRAGESSYAFLDRSARASIACARVFLTEAFHRYPESERDEIVARIRSGDETHFRSATFEVYLHEALIRLGHQLTPHPDPGTGKTKRPDFLVKDSKGSEFFLEAVLASEQDGRNPAAEAMKKSALGYLNETPHKSFLIDVESEGDPTSQPSGKALSHAVHTWLGKLEPNSLRE